MLVAISSTNIGDMRKRRVVCIAAFHAGEWSMINGDENGVAWNARLQQLMRAAQTLGPGNAQLIVNTANPFDQDDEGDGPFGLTGVVTAHDADSDSSDSDDDEPGELYVEDDDELMMEETRRDVWKALRTADMGACQSNCQYLCTNDSKATWRSVDFR